MPKFNADSLLIKAPGRKDNENVISVINKTEEKYRFSAVQFTKEMWKWFTIGVLF